MHSVWGIVVHYTVGSLALPRNVFTQSMQMYTKRKRNIQKQVYAVVADDCSTNCEGKIRFIDKGMT